MFQLRNEKAELAHALQQEQESLVNKLLRRISKLEAETVQKQAVGLIKQIVVGLFIIVYMKRMNKCIM